VLGSRTLCSTPEIGVRAGYAAAKRNYLNGGQRQLATEAAREKAASADNS
jgi:hypothetical protein